MTSYTLTADALTVGAAACACIGFGVGRIVGYLKMRLKSNVERDLQHIKESIWEITPAPKPSDPLLLIMATQWLGPGRNYPSNVVKFDPIVKPLGYLTRLKLADALERLAAYDTAFKARHKDITAVEFDVLSVSVLEGLGGLPSEGIRNKLSLEWIEELDVNPIPEEERINVEG